MSDTLLQHRKVQPGLLMILAALGVLGCVSLIGGTFVAQLLVPGHDWISDTISDLAAGELEIVMDVALYGFAAGLIATALAAAHLHLGGAGWSTGILSLALLAALVVVVGARNEYGDSDSEGVVIHIYLVYGLGAFFLIAPLTMAPGFGRVASWAPNVLYTLAAAWAVTAPVFLFLPTSIDGLVERILGLIACAIIAVMSWIFWRQAKA